MKKSLIILLLLILMISPAKAVLIKPSQQQFCDDTWRIFDNSDPTRKVMFELDGITTDTTCVITVTSDVTLMADINDVLDALATLAAVADNEFIVGTGAGTYAHESGATARTSLGLGTEDSPQFAGLTLTGDLAMADEHWITNASDGGIQAGTLFLCAQEDDIIAMAVRYADWKVGNDGDDYLRFQTVDNVPEITTVGACNLKITASGGTIDFGNENLTTTGMLTATLIGAFTSAGAINFYNQNMTNVDIDSGTIDGVALGATCTQAEWDAANTHIGEDGSSHADVVTNSAYSAVGHLPLAGGTLSGTLDLDAQLDLDHTYDGITMVHGLDVYIKNDSTQIYATGIQAALNFQSIFEPSENWAMAPSIIGCYGLAKANRDSCTGTVSQLTGYFGSCQTSEIADGGAITVTNAYTYYAGSTVKNADDTITTNTGLHVAAQTVGATNYGIYVAGAVDSTSAYFEGDISADDVTDRAQWSAWKGTSKEALDAVLAIKQTGEHDSYPVSVQRTLIEQRPTGEKRIETDPSGNEIKIDVTEPTEVSGRSLSAMITLLTEALKEQQKQIDDLKAEVERLKK
ncbi:MAG TPA: hypothetical protein VMW16_03095 [Sedimentisphaerales bacterium]|nr:hypothetical protein [Sedimentisphaerales bacterium]